MTLIYFIKQPLRSHNCKHSEPLFLLKLLQVRAGRLLTSYSFSPGAGIATLASQCQGKHSVQHHTKPKTSPCARTCPSWGGCPAIAPLFSRTAHAQPVPHTNGLTSQCSSTQPFLQTVRRINEGENNYLRTLQLLSRRYLCLCGYRV